MKKFGKVVAIGLMATIILGVLISTTACARHHNVHFHTGEEGANNGAIANQRIRHGNNAARPTLNPNKDGHEFVNWYTDRIGGHEYDFNSPVTRNQHLYARFNSTNIRQNPDNFNNNLTHQYRARNYTQHFKQNAVNRFNAANNLNNANNANRDCQGNDCFDGSINRFNRFDDCNTSDCYALRRQDRMNRGTRSNAYMGQDSRMDNRIIDSSSANANQGYDRVRQPASFEGAQNPNINIPNPHPVPLPAGPIQNVR